MTDDFGAFVPGERFRVEGKPGGPLSGLSFAAKDLFDVAGHVTGGGNPDWARVNPVPTRHAWAVQRLLDAGATLIGKTITDEVSLGILGENPFDGTARNPRAPGRVPGGSSSGSAVAVAAGLCDTALGTDTGGSVRVPASFCALYGIRPTHGRIKVTGMMSQAPTSDTTGWFARDAETFASVAAVMLGEAIPAELPRQLVIADDAFAVADTAASVALQPLVERLGRVIGTISHERMASQGLVGWANAQRTIQPSEAWETFKDWIDRVNPRMQFSVARNLAAAASITPAERARAQSVRDAARARMRALLPPGTILCQPTTPFPAPLCGQALSVLDPLRERITRLACHGGLTGVPQVVIPGSTVDGLPVGLSIIGGWGSDATLVAVARALAN
ncbi:MAG TPA: amidase [Stellaceae bacterium]|nr:amidase [Stellaceae bacterium]